mgnify:CR=1 FL=1
MIVVEELLIPEVVLDFAIEIPGMRLKNIQHFQAGFVEPSDRMTPTNLYLATFLMLASWAERQPDFAGLMINMKVDNNVPVVSPKMKISRLESLELLDILPWDSFLDGGIGIGNFDGRKYTDLRVVILNGKDAIYVVGDQPSATELRCLLSEWAQCVSRFF